MMMRILSRYFSRQYIGAFVGIALMLMSVTYFLELAELFRRTASRSVSFGNVLLMGAVKLPQTAQVVMPFIIMFAAIYTLWRFARRHEIDIARAAGLSVWQFTAPIILVVFLFGAFNVMAINPVSARLLQSYKRMETKYIDQASTLEITGGNGLWLRQPYKDGVAVIHATKISTAGLPLSLQENVMLLFLGKNEDYRGRLDAQSGMLQNGRWVFTNATLRRPGQPAETMPNYVLETELTPGKIEDSLAQPDTMSFWELPQFMDALEKTGFSTVRHRQHYYALMAEPLLLVAMVLIAIVFMQRQLRSGQGLILLLGASVSGMAVFILNNTVLALGITEAIPPFLAAWAVPIFTATLACGALLHLEEGG